MAHWRTFAPRDSMGAWDLDGRDRHVKILAIKKVRMAGIPGMKDGEKAHIYTENAKHEALKPLIAGATILSQIAQATGEDDARAGGGSGRLHPRPSARPQARRAAHQRPGEPPGRRGDAREPAGADGRRGAGRPADGRGALGR